MKSPKVSVVIPVYNGGKTIRWCLDSVLTQTYKDYEVIVVDNNSSDETQTIIREFQKKDKKIKYAFEVYKSRGAARNKGIQHAGGEIIAMTDSDCLVPNNWIEELIKPIIQEDEDAVMGFEKDGINNYWTRNIQRANWDFIQRNLNGKYINHIDTKNFAIRASLMKKLMFDPALVAFIDFDLYLRINGIAKIRFIPSVRVNHAHKDSFKEVVKLNIRRAYWCTIVWKKHKYPKNLPMAENISLRKFLVFPFWITFQFVKKPRKDTYYILVSETSWRIGVLWGLIR